MSLASNASRRSYKTWFLGGLLLATFIPAIVSVANVEVFDQRAAALTFALSLILILGSGHVWITPAYYADKEWRNFFRTRPLVFFVAPALILIVSVALVAQPFKPLAVGFVYGTTFVNLWHHSKQNWGVISLVGKNRGVDVSMLRLPLVYAWPFFAFAWAMQFPPIDAGIGHEFLVIASRVAAAAYVLFALVMVARAKPTFGGDPVVILFALALVAYFLPLVVLYGKPYSLIIWAGAHGLQYYFLVLISLAFRTRQRAAAILPGVIAAVVAVTSLSLVAYAAGKWSGPPALWESLLVRIVVGIFAGVNLAHFWLDAFIWRLSEKDVRTLHGDALAF